MSEVQNLLQYLYSGDYWGFIQAIYVTTFGSSDVFYAIVSMLFTIPIYVKTKSLILLSMMWILLGGFFLVAMPLVSDLAVLFLVLGIGSMLYELYTLRHSA